MLSKIFLIGNIAITIIIIASVKRQISSAAWRCCEVGIGWIADSGSCVKCISFFGNIAISWRQHRNFFKRKIKKYTEQNNCKNINVRHQSIYQIKSTYNKKRSKCTHKKAGKNPQCFIRKIQVFVPLNSIHKGSPFAQLSQI